MRKALRAHLIPTLSKCGFAGGASHCMRFRDGTQDLLSLQYWKYGGSFILEFGGRSRGPLRTSWGEVIAEDKLDVAYLAVTDRARLQDRLAPEEDTFAGFAFAGFGDDMNKYHALARRVAGLIPQVDAWLRTGELGPDITPFSGA